MARTHEGHLGVLQDLEGTVIRDRYQLERFIKAVLEGVYLAHDSVMNRQVAVKLLLPSDPVMGSRFEREARGLCVKSSQHSLRLRFRCNPRQYHYMVSNIRQRGDPERGDVGGTLVQPQASGTYFFRLDEPCGMRMRKALCIEISSHPISS